MNNSVTILPRVRVPAWQGDPSEKKTSYPVMDIREALEASYHTDAMILGYGGDLEGGYPRLGIAAAAYYELMPDEAPTLNVALFDVDCPGHAPSTDEWVADQIAMLTDAQRKVWAWYRTAHGMRFVTRLSEPVPLLKANALLAILFDELDARGVDMDPACKRWYRLYRAPRARGLDFPMDLSPLDNALDVAARGDLDEMAAAHFGPIAIAAMPLEVPTKPPTKTDVKRELGANSTLGDDLAKGRFAVPEGRRHEALLRAAGDILAHTKSNNPRVPFDLLDYAAVQMGKARGELWRLCEWATARAVGEREAVIEERSEAAERVASKIGATNEAEVKRRVIIDAGKSMFVLDEFTGQYIGPISHDHQLPGALRDFAPTLARDWAHPGASKTDSVFHLASVADRIVYSYNPEEAGYDAAHRTFTLTSANVCDDIYPEFNAGVDEWLRAFDDQGHLLDWLAAFPVLDKPVCALYLNTPPGLGKDMLAAGLARIYSPRSEFTPYASLLSRFNAALIRCPLVWANEAVPTDAFQASGSSLFRRVVGGSTMPVEEKHEVRASLHGCPRVLVTANNAAAFSFKGEEIQRDDLRAIQERIGYIDIDHDGPLVVLDRLAKVAGYRSSSEYTYGEGWVDGGLIARHVLWLADNRPIVRGKRFLVEGWDSDLFDTLLSSVGSTELVAIAIITAMAAPNMVHTSMCPSVRWFGGDVFVHLQTFVKDWSTITGFDDLRHPGFGAFKGAVERLSVHDDSGKPKQKRLSPAGSEITANSRYWRLDARRVGKIAERLGICSISDIVERASRAEEPDYDPEWETRHNAPTAKLETILGTHRDPEAKR